MTSKRIKIDSTIAAAIIAGVFGLVAIAVSKLLDTPREAVSSPLLDRISNAREKVCLQRKTRSSKDNAQVLCFSQGMAHIQQIFTNADIEDPPTLCKSSGDYAVDGRVLKLHVQNGKCENGNAFTMRGDFSCVEEDRNSLRCVVRSGDIFVYEAME